MNANTVLALGGGGARGLAHLGVLEELESAEIPIDRIVGLSIGSLLGTLYAFEPDIDVVNQRVVEFVSSEAFQRQHQILGSTRRNDPGRPGLLWLDRIRGYLWGQRIFQRVTTKSSLLPARLLKQIVEAIVPDADIADAKIPLAVVAVDLRSGARVVLEKGPARLAVQGSSALPGIFPPVEIDGKLLADIGVHCSLPLESARSFAPAHVIAVDVSPELQHREKHETALDVMMRMDEIGGHRFRTQVESLADTLIRPRVGELEWSDFSRPEDTIARGRDAGREHVLELRERLQLPARRCPVSNRWKDRTG